MRWILEAPFTKEEVKTVLSQMHPNKASKPDGMAPLFLSLIGDIIGQTVTEAVLDALNTDILPPDLNHTFISLIPKNKHPDFIADFRPISICNVLYKLVAKD